MTNRFFNFRRSEDYGLHVWLFLYIGCLNILMLLLGEHLEGLGYRGWAFFFVNILFFVFPEPHLPSRMIKLAAGAATGCLMAYLTVILYIGPLSGLEIWGLILPVVGSVAVILLLGPFIPLCFNVAAFAYFTAALIYAEDAVLNLVPSVLWAIAGVFICDGGTCLIVRAYKSHRQRRAEQN